MILCIADILNSEELNIVLSKLQSAKFVDGQLTAGWHARLVKQNTQLQDDGSIQIQELKTLITQALKRNSLFQMSVLPKTIRPLLFSRYEREMSYGSHIDNAIMNSRENSSQEYHNLIRSDVSITLFLSEPTTYTGGELVIESTQGEQAFKLSAGSMIVYPSSTLHRVEPVTQGIRLAAVTWVQSLVRDSAKREILFDLDTTRQILFGKAGKTPEFDLISKSHANLLRQWSEV
jgi:PKHD-type hydroxylase